MAEVLQIRDLKTYFYTESGVVKAVDGISYRVDEKEIVGLVGESGCGKSVSQLSVMQLIRPPGEIVGGEVIFEGRNLLQYKSNAPEMLTVRGARIAMIFQEPMTSLNPVLTINRQVTEMMELHLAYNPAQARERAIEMLDLVGIPDARKRIGDYPHQFSGGMRQRVMIAMALSCNPMMLIADEPTTALDVTTQAQLLQLMKDMVDKFSTSLVIVTHNLGIVARYVKKIYIMYAGRIVESGHTKSIFSKPCHPYTLGLLKSIPRLDEEEGTKLVPIEGLPPSLIDMPATCAFLPRCSHKIHKCLSEPWPPLRPVDEDHFVSCHVNLQENVGEPEVRR